MSSKYQTSLATAMPKTDLIISQIYIYIYILISSTFYIHLYEALIN